MVILWLNHPLLYSIILKYAYNVNVTILDRFHWLSQYDPTLVRSRFFDFSEYKDATILIYRDIKKDNGIEITNLL